MFYHPSWGKQIIFAECIKRFLQKLNRQVYQYAILHVLKDVKLLPFTLTTDQLRSLKTDRTFVSP